MEHSKTQEMFSVLGPVTIKPVSGGKGMHWKGVIIAVEFHGDILLRADGLTAPAFKAACAIRWAYEGKTGRAVNMPYWSIPAEAFDDRNNTAQWVNLAYQSGFRLNTLK